MSVTPAPPNAWPFGPNQLTNRLVSVTPAVFAQTASPKKKVVLGVAQSEAKVLMVSTSAGANGRSPGCLPALRKFPMMPFELTAAPLLFTSRESRKARESSLEVDAEDEENNGTHISVTRATKAAMRVNELRFVRELRWDVRWILIGILLRLRSLVVCVGEIDRKS